MTKRHSTITGQQIRALRRAMKITQAALSQQLNVTVSTVSNWECGRFGPHGDTAKKIQPLLALHLKGKS